MTKAATKVRRRAAREAMVIAAVAFEGVEDVGGHTGWKFMCGGVNVSRTVADLHDHKRIVLFLLGDGTGRHGVRVRRSY